jgi:hypothetical protein
MRILSALALLLCAGHARAEFAFDLRETISGHPSMVRKTTEITSHMFISGGKIAKLQNQIVQIIDHDSSLLTLVDYRDKKFSTLNLTEGTRDRDLRFDQKFGQDIRTELVQSGQSAEWDGRPVKRTVFRIQINSDPGPGEWLYTVDASTEPPPDFEPTSRAISNTEDRYDQDLDAEIQALVFINIDRFKDLQKARKGDTGRSALVIHSVAQFRLKKGAPLLETIGQELAGQPLITEEMEVLDFKLEPIDFSIFLVPPGFEQVDMHELFVQQDIRANQ